MDQDLLVGPNIAEAQKLTRFLDAAGVKPKAVVWVREDDTSSWRLWIVPSKEFKDHREFYGNIIDVIAAHRDQLPNIEASDTQPVSENHPAIQGLNRGRRIEGESNVYFSNNMFNGFYLPNAIVIRMAL